LLAMHTEELRNNKNTLFYRTASVQAILSMIYKLDLLALFG
jgi:hypothetical protein